jgi:peptidoglycan/xylan/chitin deacetylase (PgdA/CDA1 family)
MGCLVADSPVAIPAGFTRGLLSITFDDGMASQYVNGVLPLQKHRLVATFYLTSDLLGRPDYMSGTQTRDLINRGHEIASHTFSHPYLTCLTPNELQHELTRSKETLESFSQGIAHFASPFGDYDTNVLESVKKHYASHRTVNDGFNARDTFDLYRIKVQNIRLTTTVDDVRAWIEQAAREKTWLVLVYHQLNEAGDFWSVTPRNFERQLWEIEQSGIHTATIGQALAEIRPQLSGGVVVE